MSREETLQMEGQHLQLPRILIVEQAPLPLEKLLEGFPVRCERMSWDLFRPERLRSADAGLIVLAGSSSRVSHFLEWLRTHPVDIPMLAVFPVEILEEVLPAAVGTIDDFFLWTASPAEVRQRVARFFPVSSRGVEAVIERLTREMGLDQLIGNDPAFLRVLEMVPRVAGREGAVLITGETGSGKELCARAVHYLSRRRDLPFIPVDCGSLPDTLVENELFGHTRGAYTDAHAHQKGLLALAEGGTLFLDEIDSLSLQAQAKLLRFLQDRSYRPLGSDQFQRADVKVIAATNRDLDSCVQDKSFRADLFYRLNVFQLHMVALRDRPGDIPLLACHFLERLHRQSGGGPKSFSAAALQRLCRYAWPGNVRELLNMVERALAFAEGPLILPGHLSLPFPDPSQTDGRATAGGLSFRGARAQAIAEFERTYVTSLLERHGGNVSRAAREAEKERRAFGRLVKKYRLHS